MASSTRTEEPIPSYVRDRNVAAEGAGLEVGVVVQGGSIYSTWLGPKALFSGLGMRIEMHRSWHNGARRSWLYTAFLYGNWVYQDGDTYSLQIEDRLPARVSQWRGIQVAEFEPSRNVASETSYHAAPKELVEAGILKSLSEVPCGQAKGRFLTRRSGQVGDEYNWSCTLCFDGKVVFTKSVYTEESRRDWAQLRHVERHQAERQEALVERRLASQFSTAARGDDAFQRFLQTAMRGAAR